MSSSVGPSTLQSNLGSGPTATFFSTMASDHLATVVLGVLGIVSFRYDMPILKCPTMPIPQFLSFLDNFDDRLRQQYAQALSSLVYSSLDKLRSGLSFL